MSEQLKIVGVFEDKITKQMKILGSGVKNLTKDYDELSHKLQELSSTADKTSKKQLRGLAKVSAALEKQQKMYRGLQRAALSASLSILFTGFAIRRFTDKAFRGMFQTMQQAVGDTHRFSVATNQLRANWEFLKFTLMDALMQSGLFDWVVGKLISLIRWVANLDDKWHKFIVIGLATAAALGTAFIILGQAGLFIVGNILHIVSAVKWLWKIGVVAFKGVAAAVSAVSWPVIALIALFALIVAGIIFVAKRWDLVVNGMKIVWNWLVMNMQGAFQGMVNWVISGINNILKAYNWVARKIGRDELGLLGEYTGMESRMDARGDTLWRLDAERTAMQAERTGGTTINNYDIDNNIEAQSADMGVTEMDRALSDYFDRSVGSTY